MKRSTMVLVVMTLSLVACTSAPTSRDLAVEAVTAMGGNEKLQGIQTMVLQGSGSRTRLGQIMSHGAPEDPAQLTNLVETVDLANGRAAHEYDVARPGFMQHRKEVLTKHGADGKLVGIETVAGATIITSPSGLFSWAAHNSPDALLRRNIVSIAMAAAESADMTEPAADRDFNGRMLQAGTATTPAGEQITLFFNPDTKLIEGFEVTDTETMLGDVPAQYVFGDYKDVDGVMLPHSVTIKKQGVDYSSVQYSSITLNDPAAAGVFTIPENLLVEADQAVAAGEHYAPMKMTKVADNVYQAQSFRHHTMVVEFPTFLALVEAPYTEAQSMVLAQYLEDQIPGKPIRYVAITHPHFDHTGGVRGIASRGATIVAERRHEQDMKDLLDTPHTNPPDELQKRKTAGDTTGMLETFDGKHVISDGGQTLELYAITGSPHVEPMVIAYVPGTRVLFNSDLFFPGTGGAGSPAAAHLLESIRELNLRVDTMVGGHGNFGPFQEIVTAVGSMTPSSN